MVVLRGHSLRARPFCTFLGVEVQGWPTLTRIPRPARDPSRPFQTGPSKTLLNWRQNYGQKIVHRQTQITLLLGGDRNCTILMNEQTNEQTNRLGGDRNCTIRTNKRMNEHTNERTGWGQKLYRTNEQTNEQMNERTNELGWDRIWDIRTNKRTH